MYMYIYIYIYIYGRCRRCRREWQCCATSSAPPGSGSRAGSSSSLLLSSLQLSDTTIYEPSVRALLGTASHFCPVVVLKLRTVPLGTALSRRERQCCATSSAPRGSGSRAGQQRERVLCGQPIGPNPLHPEPRGSGSRAGQCS